MHLHLMELMTGPQWAGSAKGPVRSHSHLPAPPLLWENKRYSNGRRMRSVRDAP